MAGILEYLDWRGDVPFTVDPFGEVDALLLAELGYVPFEGVVPERHAVRIGLAEAQARFRADSVGDEDRMYSFTRDCLLLEKLAAAPRFRGTYLTGYRSIIDPAATLQFSALTVLLPDGTTFVSFRGTDGTVTGWKEDLSFAVNARTAAQALAVSYLDDFFTSHPRPLRLGGHSKGGNLAMYAAAFCLPLVQASITEVYAFDAPGFREELVAMPSYRAMTGRIRSYVPGSSVVGMLLETGVAPTIIRSDAAGLQQHVAYSWQIERNRLVRENALSKSSGFVDRTVDGWLADLDDEERTHFIEALGSILGAPEKETLRDISRSRHTAYPAMLKAAATLPPEQRRAVLDAVYKIVRSGKDAIIGAEKPSVPPPLPAGTEDPA